jgi:hypothetical protein
MRLDVDLNKGAIEAQLRAISFELQDKIVPRALNRTATTVRASVAREIASDLSGALKVGEVKKAIRLIRATRATMVAILRASGRKRIPLTAFRSFRQSKKGGVTVRVGETRYAIPQAFVRPRGGRSAALVRAASFGAQLVDALQLRRKRVRKRGPDYPIAEIFAPGVPFLFVQGKIESLVRREAPARFAQVIAQELKFRAT